MQTIASKLVGSFKRSASAFALSAAVLAGVGGLAPAAARAGHDRGGISVDVDIRLGDRDRGRYDDRRTRVWVPAEYRTVCEKRFVEPVYEDRCDRVWVEPVYETRCERVWVEERCEVREVQRYDRRTGRWCVERERVVLSPGHWESRDTRVRVREGRFEEVRKRVCVREGRWETVDRQELVSDGHWEWRTERVARADRDDRRPFEVVNPRVRF